MNNNDNNLDDFLKNQLNRFDEPIEDWAKPDPGDWDLAAAQIPLFNKTTFWTTSNIGLISIGTLLICSIFYIWQLNQHVNHLEEKIDTQYESIQEMNKNIQNINEQHTNKTINIEEEYTLLKEQNKHILSQNQQLKIINSQQQQVISGLIPNIKNKEYSQAFTKNKVEAFQKNQSINTPSKLPIIKNDNKINASERIPIAQNSITKEDDQTLTTDNIQQSIKKDDQQENSTFLTLIEMNKLSENTSPHLPKWQIASNENDQNNKRRFNIELPKINFKNIEIGYEHRFQHTKTVYETELKELTVVSDNGDIKDQFVPLHGITLGIPINDKWRIQTGARFSSTYAELETYGTGVYNKENEYILSNGSIAKDFNVDQAMLRSMASSEIQLIFEENNQLENGDVFTFFSEWEQEQFHVQVPLGISYHFGKKALNWSFGAGLQWNKVWNGYYKNRFKMFDNDENELALVKSPTTFSSQKDAYSFLGTYTSVGLHYQVFKKWSLNAGMTYNYNFNHHKIDRKSNRADRSLSLGFRYHL